MKLQESKISIPDYSPYLIRGRLFDFLERSLGRKLILITTEGGYGKTTLVSSFIKEKNIDSIWYQLSQFDRDQQTFLSYFKSAISKKMSGIPFQYEVTSDNAEEELKKLVEILSTWPSPLVIVLDNYQEIDQCEEIESILHTILAHSSSSVTFIITSRLRPNLPLLQLKLQKQLAELKTKDLAFTMEEVADFFNHLHQLPLLEHELELIYDKTEGWAASLQLLEDLIKDMKETDLPSFWHKFNGTPEIYHYLGSEILASQPEEIKTFLYKTSLLSELDDDIVNTFLEIQHANEILAHLIDNHLFIYQNSEGKFKYHHLFRSFLLKELYKNGSDQIRDLNEKLSLLYQKKGDFFHAFAHSIASENFVLAARLMTKMKERFNSSKFLVLVDGLLHEISPTLSTASVSLFLFRCIPLEILKDLASSMESYLNDRKDRMSPLELAQMDHQLAAMYFYTGDIIKSLQLCNDALQQSTQNKDREMIAVNMALASMIYFFIGKPDEAERHAKDALSYPDQKNHFHPYHLASWILVEINLERKRLDTAKSLLEETLKLSKTRDDCSIVFPYCSMGKYFRLKGDYSEDLNWIQKAEEIVIDFNLEFDSGYIYLEMALAYFETKQWNMAEKALQQASQFLSHSTYLKTKVQQMQIKLLDAIGKDTGFLSMELQKTCNQMDYHWLFEKETLSVVQNHQKGKEPKLELCTLGDFKVTANGKEIILKRKSSLKLLLYMIVYRRRKIEKDTLIEELFPEGSFQTVNNQFYVTLSYLRKSLEPTITSGKDSLFIQREGPHYYFDLEHVYLDLDEFAALIEKDPRDTREEYVEKLKKAEDLYKGDFLESYPYESFLELDREGYRVMYLNILQEIGSYYWDIGNYKQGIEYFEKTLKKEAFDETIYIQYIKRLIKANLMLNAKKVSELYKKNIEKELGIPVGDKLQKIFSYY